jgi:drug/metabolite transporter (DMT)-like permease
MCVGVPLGLVNAAFLVFMVLSLQNVDAVIVFPILSASTIVLNLIASRILWSERFTRRQVVGAVVATAVIFLAQA